MMEENITESEEQEPGFNGQDTAAKKKPSTVNSLQLAAIASALSANSLTMASDGQLGVKRAARGSSTRHNRTPGAKQRRKTGKIQKQARRKSR